MVDKQTDGGYYSWTMLIYELEDAQDAIRTLLKDAAENPEYSEEAFRVDIAHVYMHLNRAWNCRNATEAQHQDEALVSEWAEFPKDINPANPLGF